MSLNFEFRNKELFNKMSEEDKKVNDAFIYGCMFVGLGEITDKNAEEWRWRYAFGTKLNGAFFYTKKNEPFVPSIEEVKKRIGLWTNCFPNKTRNQFVAQQVKHFELK